MKKFEIGIWEEISGFIRLEADSEEEAKEKAEELINEHGVEMCLYPSEEIRKDILWHKHCHGDRELLGCEEVNE